MSMLHGRIKHDTTHGMVLFWEVVFSQTKVQNMIKKTPEFEIFPFLMHAFTWIVQSQFVSFSHLN